MKWSESQLEEEREHRGPNPGLMEISTGVKQLRIVSYLWRKICPIFETFLLTRKVFKLLLGAGSGCARLKCRQLSVHM